MRFPLEDLWESHLWTAFPIDHLKIVSESQLFEEKPSRETNFYENNTILFYAISLKSHKKRHHFRKISPIMRDLCRHFGCPTSVISFKNRSHSTRFARKRLAKVRNTAQILCDLSYPMLRGKTPFHHMRSTQWVSESYSHEAQKCGWVLM